MQNQQSVINKLVDCNSVKMNQKNCVSIGFVLNMQYLVGSFAGLMLFTVNVLPASAETFANAYRTRLDGICKPNGIQRLQADFNKPSKYFDPVLNATALGKICTFGDAPTNTTQSTGSPTQATPVLIAQQQLKQARTAEAHKTKPGASADAELDMGGGFSTFLVSGAASVEHHQNEFEQGYRSTLPSVTVGGDYRFNSQLTAGLAFNYFNQNADYTGQGGFNIDSYSPLVYLNYRPFDRAFTDIVLSYANQQMAYNRFAQAFKKNANPDDSVIQATVAPKLVSADFDRDLFGASVQTGYDFLLHRENGFTIGPRLGVNIRHWMTADYEENSNTGFELRYLEPDQTSIQSNLGLTVSASLFSSVGTLTPYLTANWVHEFANDQRAIQARFVQDPGPVEFFAFSTERPARDWVNVDIGLSWLISPQLMTFVNFSTVQGNTNFVSYGGTAGLKVNW